MILKLLREGLGRVVIFADHITRSKPMVRSSEAQAEVEAQTGKLALYQFYACPFCIKTRRAMHRLNLPIETRNAQSGSPWREELEEQGGKVQVPSLKIVDDKGTERWLYESNEIISYLEQEFSSAA